MSPPPSPNGLPANYYRYWHDTDLEMPEMPKHRYDPRSPLGSTYLRQAYWQERSRNEGIAQSVGERVLYGTFVLAATILTIGSATAVARKINK